MAAGALSRERETARQCAVTRERCAPEFLLRFVLDPEGRVVPDLKATLPGRGVWISCNREILDKAIATGAFDRGFRQAAAIPDGLVDQTSGLLERDALQRLSLANKAGAVLCGFDKVDKAIRNLDVSQLLHASDAGSDGCEKLNRLFSALTDADRERPQPVTTFNREQLSLALGRPNVVHAALKFGSPAEKFVAATVRLDRFRAKNTAESMARVPETEEI